MRFLSLLWVVALLVGGIAFAQEQPAPPAHLSFVEGTVTLYRGDDSQLAVMNMPVLDGDRIRTGDGRAEVVLADGSAIEIDSDSEVEFLGGTRVRVLAGTIEHHAADVNTSSSSQYLPADLRPYGNDLDRNGTWANETGYGNVWYPTVEADWRPYYYGYWAPVPIYGWNWIGYNPWSWPTHHYGRWGHGGRGWFWIPGPTWGAAWVSWGTAPGYVSWCPLGSDGRPVAAFSIGYHNAWNAWTFVPRDHFGVAAHPVQRYAVEPYRIASTTPFVIHRTAPVVAGRSAPAAAQGSVVAVPRFGGSPNTIQSPDGGTYRVPAREGRVAPITPPGRAPAAPPVAGQPGRTVAPSIGQTTPQPGTAYRTPGSGAGRGEYRAPGPGYQDLSGPPQPRRPTIDRQPPAVERPTYQPASPPPGYQAPRAEQRPAPRARESAPARQAAPPAQRQSAPAKSGSGSHGGSLHQGGRSSGRSSGTSGHGSR